MCNELISVIVPVYNTGSYLKKCLDSILSQTYHNFEIILVNDGSNDKLTLEILSQYQNNDHIRYYSKNNEGISKTRNFALDKASGQYIMFVDSDDFIDSTMLEDMHREMLSSKSDIVACAYWVEYEHFKGFWSPNVDKCLNRKETLSALVHNTVVNNYLWAKLYKKSLFDGLSFDVNYKGFEDVMFMPLIYSRINQMSIIKGRYYHYVMRKGSYTNGMNHIMVLEMFEAFKAQEKLLNELDDGNYSNYFNYYRSELMYYKDLIFNRVDKVEDIIYDDTNLSFIYKGFRNLLKRIVKWKYKRS